MLVTLHSKPCSFSPPGHMAESRVYTNNFMVSRLGIYANPYRCSSKAKPKHIHKIYAAILVILFMIKLGKEHMLYTHTDTLILLLYYTVEN